ncbi:hypothetical protein JCM3774_005208 [Rhodotorula dairenensis]
MLTLDTLPLPVLLHVVDQFPRDEIADPRIITTHVGLGEPVKLHVPEVGALAACNRALRRQLLPTLFSDMVFGDLGASESVLKPDDMVTRLARPSDEVLACVRNLCIGSLSLSALETASAYIDKMPKLERVGWYAAHPVPPLIARALCNAPSLTSLTLYGYGVDSLPGLLPLAGQVTKFYLNTIREAPIDGDVIKLCPDVPGLKRRCALAWSTRNVARLAEQREAFFRHLAPFISQASKQLEELSLDGVGLIKNEMSFPWFQRLFDAMVDDDRQYPAFPRLTGLWLSSCDAKALAFTHLLKSCTETLRFLEIHSHEHGALQAPGRPLPSLREFSYVMQDNMSCVDIVNCITRDSPLQILNLNGARPTDIRQIFGPPFRCGDSLRQLGFHGAPWDIWLTLSQVQVMVAACPNLAVLDLKGSWELEAADLLEALEPLKKLRRFAFDHPWEKPRDIPFPWPDGRTIRSARNGDFRVVSVMGTSMEEEIARRIREDIDAVRPTYQQRFKDFAEQNPALELVRWSCTEVVVWEWTFERLPGKKGQTRIICHDEADIPYGRTIVGPKLSGDGVYMTAPMRM